MIKLCPFCGATESDGNDEGPYLHLSAHQYGNKYVGWIVCCNGCGAIGPEKNSREAAIAAWNTIGARRED